ncbi:sigma 54-interacting transcriptional regulator [Alloacidobacterium dinghuense]|uniref:Sigma 54-interacting transcriptional regulator n=1 Tax=Alloacidobacterium dinghuense TaxID=2763107 RepID=A0A7G8BD68_9BACT|nr:sigma 54-interacting transcriptional regulator [Alloacidobacterium dinghuense]QNI30488.1 sigma 54-interacting transcriptional regulator [Alloacidobacterium dinghuense]
MAAASEYMLEPIRDGAEFTLYRARQHGNPSPVLVVAPTAEQPLPQSLRRLEHEYSLAAELEPAWAAKPLALTRHEGRTILVLADPGGEPLNRILEQDREQPLDLARFLRLAINLATALGHAHQRGLIHKDVKPENVLVDEAGCVWLTGFGIASRLPRERQAPAPPEIIVGSLAYMSPEQTGRMNRSMDTRSDLYSLGITLYQMLSGGLPFAAADPLEWVHCHIARQPVPPTDGRNIPKPLSDLIMKLLAKNPEERYQTAAGLEADLRRCLTDWQSHGRIDSFPLGTDDASDRLLIPEKLYGREREVDALLGTFDRVVAGGRPELLLVSGYSGVGKSAVVNELHKWLVPPRGLFASGKFDQYKRDIPYATVAQAFHSFIRPLLGKPEAELSKWRDDLNQALRPNGSLVLDLVPELRLIIGAQPPVAGLPPQEAKARAHLAFRQFIGVFARPEHPLALFLDDLQWLDAATLDFLEDLLVQQDLAHLLVVGAYRDNEVDAAHPLMRKLSAIREAGGKVQEIRLAPLGTGDLGHLIADALHCDPRRASSLAQLVHEKTAGNPFFAIQFIRALVDERLIAFDHGDARWQWDLNAIRAKAYTENVVDLMVAKLNRFPATTQRALQQFACIGNSAEAATLSAVLELTEQEVEAELWKALNQELIVESDGFWRFGHDRVQEAAYSTIAPELRAQAHLRIGRLLLAHTPPEKLEGAIFEIVNQFNRGAELITSENERFQVAELNLVAGKRAKAATAYASALKYFIAGEALLNNDPWESRRDLILGLELHRAECEFLTGELAVAEKRLTTLSSRAANTVERATVQCLRIDLYTVLEQPDRAVAACLEYLRHLGVEWPIHPSEDQARSEYERIWSQLGNREIEEVMDFPLMSDPTSVATLDVLTKVLPAALFTDWNLVAMVICRAISLSIERGNSDGSCVAYVFFSKVAGPRFGDYKAGFRFGQLGYELVDRRGLGRFRARTYLWFAQFVMPWTRHVRACRGLMRQALEAATRAGDLTVVGYSLDNLNTNFLAAGDPLAETQLQAENGLEFAERMRFRHLIDVMATQLGLIRTLRGLTYKFGRFDDGQLSEALLEQHLKANPATNVPECWYWIRKLQARFFAGDYPSALDAAAKAQPILWTSAAMFETAEYHFYAALTHAASCTSAVSNQDDPLSQRVAEDVYPSLRPKEYQQHLEALAAHYRQLEVWAENCAENFDDRAALVGAEIARIEGRELDAERLYEEAIRSAGSNGFVHNEALAYEVAARFYTARGFETFADAYLRNARNCYDRWGASGKVRLLDERYPRPREERTPTASAMLDPPGGRLDIETVVKASQAISSEMVLPRLIEKLLRIAVENAGAERGLLILRGGDESRIEAEATTGPDRVEVVFRQVAVAPSDLPQSALHYVIRTHDGVLLDDASSDNVYSKDEYVQLKRSRSVLCLPIVRQTKFVGALYLENNLTPGAFTPDRVTVLTLLASQAAISLENAALYGHLQLQVGLLQRLPVSAWTLKPDGTPDFVNQVWLEFSGQTLDFVRSHPEAWMTAVHPEDREAASKAFWEGICSGQGFAFETRSLRAQDGTYRWHLQQAVVLRDAEGKVLKFVGTTTDIDDQKRAEEKIRQSEKEARQLLDLSPLHITELGADGARLYTNRASLDYFGITLEEWQDADLRQVLHPQDAGFVINELPAKFQIGSPFEYEARLKRKGGQHRWFHYRLSPMSDEQGRITRWYAAGTDIEELKLAGQRLQEENVSLREEVDKASMFEEIVGTSALLKKVLSGVSKVAPTDSTVLITGETGTGKELVARAIHRRSRRSSHAFVSVNCAMIPRDLIASELFGHEKGAFTGATQLRSGRFELAEKGTIFLDEVGELPAETQVVLLRVLQEREFERIGGKGPIRADVRVIAATNRDLESAIESGTFRSDLFYRLNVFPIEMPPLRKRQEDIPLLVTYFLNRFARKAGRHFTAIDKQSLDLLQTYAWPGNIRELQNVIERSVIVNETQTFSVDESWLSPRPSSRGASIQTNLFNRPPAQEKALIEAVLRECGGRVYGPRGAAARLGIPRTTLETKIKSLKIDKNRFRGQIS